jgi:hypothetical protein
MTENKNLSPPTNANDASKTVAATSAPKHNMEKEDLHIALRVSIYTIIIFVIITYFLIDVWPATTNDLALNATRSANIYGTGASFLIGPETSLILIMMFSGTIGACVFSLFAISHHLGADKDFDKAWQAWYLLRPIVGAGLALIFYFVLRGGVLTIGANLNNLNLVGVAAISGLVGMFSEHAMHKLQDLADTLFGIAPGDDQKKTTKPEQLLHNHPNDKKISTIKLTKFNRSFVFKQILNLPSYNCQSGNRKHGRYICNRSNNNTLNCNRMGNPNFTSHC